MISLLGMAFFFWLSRGGNPGSARAENVVFHVEIAGKKYRVVFFGYSGVQG